ncbi:MAG: hypothetical protein WBN63_17255, partial [Eudoraea sp.]|uniref:hypothetical protein n=1 Tax=Eudoraea sp. TaxID=1979955 RepID=UPI003C73E0AF
SMVNPGLGYFGDSLVRPPEGVLYRIAELDLNNILFLIFTKLSKIKIVLEELRTKEGIYEQPMLTSQIKYLYNMMNEADQEIGQDALDRFADLQSKFVAIQQSIN